MNWMEFCTLIGGLMEDTPLGHVVGIRAEQDMETIRAFSAEQSRIYETWQKKMAEARLADKEKLNEDMEALSNMLASMFG